MEVKMEGLDVRMARRSDWIPAMNLAWRTFLKFEAGDYTPEGVKSFYRFITDPKLEQMFLNGQYRLFTAFLGETLIGMAGMRNDSHLSLLFVEEDYHRQGVASALLRQIFRHCLTQAGASGVTVNASPYAVGFYHRIGFQDTNIEQSADGIRYTPMLYKF